MKKQKNCSIKTVIGMGTTKEFFERGLKIAKFLDSNKKIRTKRNIINFEDPKDFLSFISNKKMNLMCLIRKQPESVTVLAKKLRRERSSVDRDIRILESYGLVKTYYETNPGHGRYKIVEPISKFPVELRATF